MFGDRVASCVDEVSFGLVLLKDKAPTWFDFVLEHTKSIECKSGQGYRFTHDTNVFYNMIFRKTARPEVFISTDAYNDGSSNTTSMLWL
jgi:hypothetical protein